MSIPADAYTFTVNLCKKQAFKCDPWPPGLVIDLARLAGIEFSEERHWGPVFQRLHKDGYIKRKGLFSRESSNGSMRPGWIAV